MISKFEELIAWQKSRELVTAIYIMNNTFFIGVYPGIDEIKMEYIQNPTNPKEIGGYHGHQARSDYH